MMRSQCGDFWIVTVSPPDVKENFQVEKSVRTLTAKQAPSPSTQGQAHHGQ